jgi:FAD-dependent urate hydroxylase
MDVIIIGAGVAGLATAIALRQRGIGVRIFERRPAPSHIGAGIVLWPNATFVLERFGLLEEVAAVSGRPAAMKRISATGEPLGNIDIELICRAMGYPALSVLRCELQDILLRRLNALGTRVHYGQAVTGIKVDEAGDTSVRFSDGTVYCADLVIGADGRMASQARRYVCGVNAPVYQGFVNWIGVFESPVARFSEPSIADYWGVGERFGVVPITARKAYWAGGVAAGAIRPRDPSRYKAELLSVFSHWPEPVPSIIAQTPPRLINKIYVHDHNPIQKWHRDRVVLIGDAAHAPLPTSGQGACQALEDAWHLAGYLPEGPGELDAALVAFTAKRRKKTADIAVAARRLAASLFNRDAQYCEVRDRESRRTDFNALANAMAAGWSRGLPVETSAWPD